MPKPSDEIAELPDDFFNDLADTQFLDEVMVENDDLSHMVDEINRLQNDIKIRKQKIRESEANLKRERRSRSRSRSNSRSRRKRRRSLSRTRSPHKHSRHDERIREKRYPLSPVRGRLSRRSRSKSPIRQHTKRSSSTHRNLSFLEELAQKFAEEGRDFPEKDALLMGGQNQMVNNMGVDLPNAPPIQVPEFRNVAPFDQPVVQQPMISISNFPQQSMASGFNGTQQGMFYGINPMNIMSGNSIAQPISNLTPVPNITPFPTPISHADMVNSQILPQSSNPIISDNEKALIDRNEQAIKLIRARDNKVPIMKFLYNRTSMVVSNANGQISNSVNKSPLQAYSKFNVSFKMNAKPSDLPLKNSGLKMLPKRVKDVAQALGINSELLFEKMRTKELTNELKAQISSDHTSNRCDTDADSARGDILIQTNTVPLPFIETAEMETQTDFNCDKCSGRYKRTMVNVHSQTFFRGVSIGVQTNEKDYREPIVELISRMTAAQLVAIKDFANLFQEPRPRNTDEMYKMRERLIDIYSLSQRDADAVRAAEENNRLNDGPYMERRGDMFGEGSSRDFDCRSNDSRSLNGRNMSDRNQNFGRNIDSNDFINDRNNMMDERQRFREERFRGVDGMYQQRLSQDEDDDIQRQRYIELERQREFELEIAQRRFEEQREEERLRQIASNFPQRQNQMKSDDEMMFRDDRELQMRQNMSKNDSGSGGTMNRRGRGAFRRGRQFNMGRQF